VNDTASVQLLYINFFLFRVEELYVMSFDHVTLITTVIVGCQCIAMVQNRYQFFNRLV